MFIIVYDDDDCLCVPMKFDADGDGAVCCSNTDAEDSVALFETKAAAQKAIRISVKFAQLCEAQGKSVNTEFTEGKKNVRIVPCDVFKSDFKSN